MNEVMEVVVIFLALLAGIPLIGVMVILMVEIIRERRYTKEKERGNNDTRSTRPPPAEQK